MKPTLKAPGIKRLKLKCDTLLSNFAFNFNLRRYIEGLDGADVFVDLTQALPAQLLTAEAPPPPRHEDNKSSSAGGDTMALRSQWRGGDVALNKVEPGRYWYCLPRHIMQFNSGNEGSNALNYVASNVLQALRHEQGVRRAAQHPARQRAGAYTRSDFSST